jgi:hypothetical protein
MRVLSIEYRVLMGVAHDKPETCPIEGVDFYKLFKDQCPDAYAVSRPLPTSRYSSC